MVFSKNYPKTSDKSVYPKWIEISLTEQEELEAEKECRIENVKIMNECIEDAKIIIKEQKLFENQNHVTRIANALFDKRASHAVFFKENKTKEKFDELNS